MQRRILLRFWIRKKNHCSEKNSMKKFLQSLIQKQKQNTYTKLICIHALRNLLTRLKSYHSFQTFADVIIWTDKNHYLNVEKEKRQITQLSITFIICHTLIFAESLNRDCSTCNNTAIFLDNFNKNISEVWSLESY